MVKIVIDIKKGSEMLPFFIFLDTNYQDILFLI